MVASSDSEREFVIFGDYRAVARTPQAFD